MDFVLNGVGHGPVANMIASMAGVGDGMRADIGLARPFIADDGHPCVTVNTGRYDTVEVKDKKGRILRRERRPIKQTVRVKDLIDAGVQLPYVTNQTSFRRDEWMMFDDELVEPQRERLRAARDLGRVNTMSFDGLGTMMIEHETVNDPGKAYMDFSGLSEGTTDWPLYQPEGQPIPIFHANCKVDLRRVRIARRSGNPIQTRNFNWMTRRVMELVEDNVIGIAGTPVEYGESSHTVGYTRTPGVYGMLNFPDRITKTDLTVPTGSNPEATITDILEMRDLLYAANHYGPYGIYHSTDWDAYLDHDYARLGGNNANMTLRQRILAIGTEGGEADDEQKQIRWVKRLDRMTPTASHAFTMIMISLNKSVVRMLNGLPVTVFQYETKGGWEIHMRIVTILLAEFFADFDGNCGLLQARTA